MTFIRTVPEDEADRDLAAIYAESMAQSGHIPNFVRAFSQRPEVMQNFDNLLENIKKTMDMRRYELVTIAAAKELKSSYCMLAHGSVLLDGVFSPAQLRDIADNPATSDLDDIDVAIMAFATKVTRDASSITADDVDVLRGHGLSDAEVFDVAAAASVRCFISKMVDALGALPDAFYRDLDPDLRDSLTVGRQIST